MEHCCVAILSSVILLLGFKVARATCLGGCRATINFDLLFAVRLRENKHFPFLFSSVAFSLFVLDYNILWNNHAMFCRKRPV
jgi:hypothetical protein